MSKKKKKEDWLYFTKLALSNCPCGLTVIIEDFAPKRPDMPHVRAGKCTCGRVFFRSATLEV